MEQNRTVIITGGSIDDTSACAFLERNHFQTVIAADSGLEFLKRNQILPDVMIGDFDSVKEETLSFFSGKPILYEQLRPEKDDTDTEHAICYALSHNAGHITLLGATGSRLDHVLANIYLLGLGLEANVPMELVDSKNRVRMVNHSITIKKEEQYGTYVSLLPFSEKVEKVTLTGMKYPLQDHCLQGFCSLGISNEIVAEVAGIQFTKGILLVIESKD